MKKIKKIIILDGIKVQVMPPDLDNDGIVGGIEKVTQSNKGSTEIIQATELGEATKEINRDDIEDNTKMSSIDMRARLNAIENCAILAYDALVSLKFLDNDTLFLTRQKKRLSVSLDGKGRQEHVDIVRGVKDADSKTGFMDKLSGMMGGRK